MQTLSFDFNERWFDVEPWPMAFRVFTEVNVYTPDPARSQVRQTPEGWVIEADRYAWAGGQQTREGRFAARLHRLEHGIGWTIEAAMPERIKTLTALVRGVPRGDLLTRRLGFSPLPPGTDEICQYPTTMRVPVFGVRHAPGDCTIVASDDAAVRAKTVAFRPEGEGLLVEIHHHEDARQWSTHLTAPPWRMTRAADPGDALKRRMDLMESQWGLKPWEERPDVPDWARAVCLVLNLHGAHWAGFVFNTYAQQLEIIRYVCERIDGRHVLAFLPGWDGRYNYNWPRYEPDEAMGGADGLRRLVQGAHEMGAHLIPQVGATSVNRAFLPPALHDCAFRDAYGNPYVKQLDWDMDRTPETYRLMANIGHPGFRRFLLDKVAGITERFGTDGIFLDINQTWHNDPAHSPVEGHRAFADELHERFDEFLLFGEGWYDGIMGAYPLSHQDQTALEAHEEIFDRYCRMTYHLCHSAAGRGSTGVYERGFSPPFVPDPELEIIPAIGFVEDTLPRHADEVDRRIEVSKAYARRKGIL